MRKLMWFVIGFLAACALSAWNLVPWGRYAIGIAVAAAAGIASFVLVRRNAGFGMIALAAIGCAAGFLWFGVFDSQVLAPASALDGVETEVSVTVSGYGWETDYGSAADGILMLEGRPYQVRIYLDGDQILTPGDTVSGVFRCSITAGEGGSSFSSHSGKGIFLLLYQESELLIQDGEIPWWAMGAFFRQSMKDRINALFPGDVAAFVRALLLGDSTDLEYSLNTALKVSGIRHVIAVSGLHVSLLYAMLRIITVKQRFLTALLGMPVLLLFAAVAGFTPSVSRACLMIGLMMAADVFQREYDSLTSLAFAALIMLLVNPLVVTSVSFQLSAGCVAGILLFQPKIQEAIHRSLPAKGKLKKFRSWMAGSISVTVSAMSLTTPLSALYFGTVSLIGIVTNLLTLWVITAVFSSALLCLVLSLFWMHGAGMFAWLLAWPVRYVVLMAKLLSRFPAAAVYTCSSYIVWWLIFVYLLLAFFLLQKKRRVSTLLCCGTIGLCAALLCAWSEPLLADTSVTAIDVGQGQSILLQQGKTAILVDCGGDTAEEAADRTAELLLSRGIRKLDALIVTHYDYDHAGAVSNVLSRVDTDLLFLPASHYLPPKTQGEIHLVNEDILLQFGNNSLTVYGPVYSGYDNENSLCVLFDTEECDILITGDRSEFGEQMLMRYRDLPDVDVLIAGHHGAADSTSEELLRAVTPETVLISAGEDNRYGHPAPALLQRLQEFGCEVYRTDLHGTIDIRR